MNDLISRQAAINVLVRWGKVPGYSKGERNIIACTISMLDTLPSAQAGKAKRIAGKTRDGITMWYQCDMCNEPVDEKDVFCRGCGRRLIDE